MALKFSGDTKDLRIQELERELQDYKRKAFLVDKINSFVHKTPYEEMYKTLFLYLIELMEEINFTNDMHDTLNIIKKYIEELLIDVNVEIFLGLNIFNVSTDLNLKDFSVDRLYDIRTSNSLNLDIILNKVKYRSGLVEVSPKRFMDAGLNTTGARAAALWVIEPILCVSSGAFIFLLNNDYLTPTQKDIINIVLKIISPTINSKLLLMRIADDNIKIREMAYTDKLTKLNNREKFHADYLDNENVYANTFALGYIDLCKFKQINDNYGHDEADKVLKRLGVELSAFIKTMNGSAYRIGGDEFVFLIPYTTQLLECLKNFKCKWENTPFTIKNSSVNFYCKMSMGVYLSSNNLEDKSEILKCADALMYRSKAEANYNIVANFS